MSIIQRMNFPGHREMLACYGAVFSDERWEQLKGGDNLAVVELIAVTEVVSSLADNFTDLHEECEGLLKAYQL